MIDKKKELELLEEKYKEIKKLNSEAESIISGIKNDVDINRETQLLEEKEKLEKILREIKDELNEKWFKGKLVELSMGMTNDYKIALEEGATLIRVGRKIFQ